MASFSAGNFLVSYLGTDRVLKIRNADSQIVGGFNVCQYVKAASEGTELWIITSIGRLVLDFASEAEAKQALNVLRSAIDDLITNCIIEGTISLTPYIHTQTIADTTWTISHGLNRFPSVTIVDPSNIVIIGEIQYIDSNNITLTFAESITGKAFLN